MCMTIIEGVRSPLAPWMLALLFASFAVLGSGPLARASTVRRFGLWFSIGVVVFLVQAFPELRLRNCASDIVSDLGSAAFGGGAMAAAAVVGMALALRARQEVVTPVVRARVVAGALAGIGALWLVF